MSLQANFWGCEGFLPEFLQTCPKSFCATFAYKLYPTKIIKTFCWYDLQKKVFMCFSPKVGRHFLKSNNFGRHFCPDFQGFCPDFQGFCFALTVRNGTFRRRLFGDGLFGHGRFGDESVDMKL